MATLVHYHVLSDSSFFLARGDDKRLIFNPENDAYLADTALRKPILMYSVDPSNDAKDIEVEVFIRTGGRFERISVLRVSQTQLRTVTEPIPAELFNKGDNALYFRVSTGSGHVRISNVVMWYHRNVDL